MIRSNIAPAQRDELETYATEIANLSGLYVLDESYFPSDAWPISKALGLAGPFLADAYEYELRERGEWTQRHPGLFLNLAYIEQAAAAAVPADIALRDEIEAQWMLATYAHELAHVVDLGIGQSVPAAMRSSVATLVRKATLANIDKRPAPIAPWHLHHLSWIRATLHIVHRLQKLSGINIPLSQVADLGNYKLSSEYAYLDALGDEPERCDLLPLTDVLATDSPQAFLDLWRHDVGRFVRTLDAEQQTAFLEDLA